MASILSAGTTTSTALNLTADVSGILQLASNNAVAAVTINATQAIGVGSSPSYGTNGQVLTSSGSGAAPTWTTVSAASLTTPSFTSTIGVGAATASASGAGITFPATASLSTNANTLDDYQEGSYTGTLTGCTTSPTTTVYYTKIGNIVHLNNLNAGITGTSNANTLRITGMPALIRPANASAAAVQGGISGSASQTIWVAILTNGDIYCNQGGGNWPTSGVKGFDTGFGITYSIY
jgi:hypothetical protein